MESVVSQIRSVLISTKGKSDLRQLQKDYRMLMGEDIPYKKLGFPNLETFIRNVPTLNVTQGPGGNLVVEAIASSKTKHMVQLISKQKTSKKRNAGSGRLPPRFSTKQNTSRARFPPRQRPQTAANQQWRAPFVDKARPRPHVHQIVVSLNNTNSFDASGSNNSSLQHRLVRNVTSPPHPSHQSVQSSHIENLARKNPRLTRSVSSPLGGSTNQVQERPRLANSGIRILSNYLHSLQREQRTSPPQTTPSPAAIPHSAPAPSSAPIRPPAPVPVLAPAGRVLNLRAPLSNDSRPRMRYMNSMNNMTTNSTSSPPLQVPGGPGQGPRRPAPSLSKNEIDTLMKEAVAQYNPTSSVWRWSSSDDSSDSSHVPHDSSHVPQTQPTYYPESEDLKKLMEFAKEYGLGRVQVKILPRATKNPRSTQYLYDCSIKVDNQSFSSYPRDCTSTADAEAEASRQALTELSSRYSKDRKNRKLLLTTEHDVLTRIPPIIECHFHGVWAAQLALDYEDKYGEQLPSNWLALLDTLPTISVEPTLDNRYVLKVCKIGEKNLNVNPVTNNLSTELSVPSNKVIVSADECWTVEVTFAASTVEVWCRFVDSDDANRYLEVNNAMQTYYSTFGGQERATNVSAGGFYVVQYDNCWSRVRVLSAEEHEVTCFFIDFGDEQTVTKLDMYDLKRDFAKEQAQAFVCRLSGLEELANMKAAQNRLEQIAGKTYLAKPQQHEMDKKNGPEAISIILYDLSNEDADVFIENDEDINRLLIRQITHDSVPELDPRNINRVYVSHATDKGNLYVQPTCEAFGKITELIDALNDVDFNTEIPGSHIPPTGSAEATSEEDARKLYLARWTQEGGDGMLYRCRIVDRSPCGQYAQLYFIDFGNTQIISLKNPENVYPLEKISEVLMAFPPLATRVRLDVELKADKKTGEQEGFGKKIMEMVPSEQLVLLKIISSMVDEDGISVPACEMFLRSESRNELFAVSVSLRYGCGGDGDGDHIDNSAEDGNNNDKTTQLAKKLERLKCFSSYPDNKPVPSTGELANPELPGPDSFLDVRVPFAVNPWNFFVQPYSSSRELLRLMEQLQDRYGGERKYCDRLNLKDVVPGRIYAAKHTDGVWYRTSVIKIINSGSISVFYCDVGYYANLTVGQLLPLDPEYLALPYQAIKARLAGIKPKDTKWSMDDCRHFEKLVRSKNFVSVVVEVQQDELYKCDAVLVLRLIDTSTDQDVHLDKLLIEKGIAAVAD